MKYSYLETISHRVNTSFIIIVSSLTGSMLHRYVGGPSLYEGSVANYYSPMESPLQSDDEEGKDELAYPSGKVRIPKNYKKKKNFSEKVKYLSW